MSLLKLRFCDAFVNLFDQNEKLHIVGHWNNKSVSLNYFPGFKSKRK